MTKAELINAIQGNVGGSKKHTGDVLDAVFESIGSAVVSDGRFSYPGFGTFTVRDRKARTGRNPRTGQSIRIPATRTVTFKPAPGLKDQL